MSKDTEAELVRSGGWRDRIRLTLEMIRANPTGRIALKLLIALTGAVVVGLGIVLIPLPGPGWLIVLAGLGIWAIEFAWAKDLLHFTRRNLQKWTRWVGRRSWPVRIVVGIAGLVFVATVAWLSVKLSLGIDLATAARAYLTTP